MLCSTTGNRVVAFMPVIMAVTALVCEGGAHAQTSTNPTRLVVPFAAGGAPDLAARVIAPRLSESLGQPVIVDKRAGAGGVIGMAIVAKAPPDGHTLVVGSAGPVAIVPGLYPKLSYDVARDFA